MTQESIYNLIELKEAEVIKPPLYHSKYPGKLPPTCSTFGATTTTTIGITNMNGKLKWNPVRSYVRKSATFGPPRDGKRKPKPDMYLKGKSQSKILPKPTKFNYPEPEKQRKPSLPKKTEKPIMGLTTNKNFIVCNAIENILPTKQINKDNINENNKFNKSRHDEFGKVPGYLSKVKKQINEEYKYIESIKQEKEARKRSKATHIELLPEEERVKLLNEMKDKWEKINHEYQQMTHLVYLDTISKIKRKEHFENSLLRLEKDIEKLSKKNVFIRHE